MTDDPNIVPFPSRENDMVPPDRPQILVRAGAVDRVADAGEDVLAAMGGVYRYGGWPAGVGRVATEVARDDAPAGTLEIIPHTEATLTAAACRAADFFKIRANARKNPDGSLEKNPDGSPKTSAADPPPSAIRAVLDNRAGTKLPVLIGTSETPIIREDGTVVAAEGYDAVTGLYLDFGGATFSPVPSDPNEADVLAARDILKEAFAEFPFAAPIDQTAALALDLTAVIRSQLPTAPAFGITANDAGCGKGLLADVPATIAFNRPMPRMMLSADDEETRKKIMGALIAGRGAVMFDNTAGAIKSIPLEGFLTAESWEDRKLGGSTMLRLPNRMLVVFTGNNLSIVGDLSRRVVPIRLHYEGEAPELREFERPDLPGWLRDNRPRLVTSVLTILSAWRKAGRPKQKGFRKLGSFEAWSREVAECLVWLGEPDVTAAVTEARKDDPERQALSRVLALWWEATACIREGNDGDAMTVRRLLQLAHFREGLERTPLADAIDDVLPDNVMPDKQAKALGEYLRRHKGRMAGGYRAVHAGIDAGTKTMRWRVEATNG